MSAQVVRTSPPFPNSEEEITIVLQTTFGNQGLKDCNCDVYLHTGAITSESNSSTDWQNVQGEWGQVIPELKMDQAAPNVYTFKLTPRSFYNVPTNQDITRLAFVFRNADGTKTARASDGGDIFIDLFSPSSQLLTLLEQPAEDIFVNTPNEAIKIVAHASKNAIFRITDNETAIYSTPDSTTKLDYNLISSTQGLNHKVQIEVSTQDENQTLQFDYFSINSSPVANPMVDTEPGLTELNETTLRLKLIAPGKSAAFALTEANDFEISEDAIMTRSVDGTYFWKDISVTAEDDWFLYQYVVDGTIKVGDPYSTLILDPFSDSEINNNYFPSYPSNATDFISAHKLGGHPFQWTDDNYEKPQPEDLRIYELLLRDFLASHSYVELKDTLSYLKNLGINTIELMPVQEFENNNSWGYNPSYHMALDKYYGDPIQFKAFVDAAHEMDMAVILDVVYNHAFGQSPLPRLYWDAAGNKPAADNPWLNPDAKHPFNVGYDFNHESGYTKAFVKQVSKYWLEEYHIDGFRFDLSKGFTQVNNPNDVGAWGRRDASRIALWKEYGDYIWNITPDALLILEHFADNDEEKELADYGFMLWGNLNHNFNEATMGYLSSSNFGGAIPSVRGWSEPHLVGFMESHDEERLMYKNLEFGNVSGDYSVKNFETAINRQKLANSFYWLIPGPKMIWQFGELGFEFSINRCQNGSVTENCRLDKKPIRWDYFQDGTRRGLYDVISVMTALRDSLDLGSAIVQRQSLGGAIKKLEVQKEEAMVIAIGNFDVKTQQATLEFPEQGEWYEIFTGDVENIQSIQSFNISMSPGEFRVYTNTFVDLPTSVNELLEESAVSVFPNPTQGVLTISPTTDLRIEQLELYDLTGRLLLENSFSFGRDSSPFGRQVRQMLQLDIQHLPKGLYFLKIETEQGVVSKKVVKE